MERRNFLKALGLLGAVAAVPSEVIQAAEAIKPIEAAKVASEFIRPVRLYDIVIFEDGTEAMVVRMDQTGKVPVVDLKPLMCTGDLGNGFGATKTYDKDTLPEIANIMYSAVSESSRNF